MDVDAAFIQTQPRYVFYGSVSDFANKCKKTKLDTSGLICVYCKMPHCQGIKSGKQINIQYIKDEAECLNELTIVTDPLTNIGCSPSMTQIQIGFQENVFS